MAITKLSEVQRDIFIPRMPRCLYFYTSDVNTWITNTTGTPGQLFSGVGPYQQTVPVVGGAVEEETTYRVTAFGNYYHTDTTDPSNVSVFLQLYDDTLGAQLTAGRGAANYGTNRNRQCNIGLIYEFTLQSGGSKQISLRHYATISTRLHCRECQWTIDVYRTNLT